MPYIPTSPLIKPAFSLNLLVYKLKKKKKKEILELVGEMEGKSCRFQIQWPTNIFFLLSFLGYLIGIPAANAAAVRQYQFDVRKKKTTFAFPIKIQRL